MRTIAMPIEFKHMVRQVGFDVVELVKSMDELVPYALIGVDHRQASVVRPFLKSLLAMNLSAEEMAEFWSSTPSGVYFTEGESVRTLLSLLLTRLEREPYLTGEA